MPRYKAVVQQLYSIVTTHYLDVASEDVAYQDAKFENSSFVETLPPKKFVNNINILEQEVLSLEHLEEVN